VTPALPRYLPSPLSLRGAAAAALHSRRSAPRGRLALTASVLFGWRYTAPLVREFLQRHPEVRADLLFVDRVVNLVEEGIDGARVSTRFDC
jgi:DNA-binding transcriptional LysR family regulator